MLWNTHCQYNFSKHHNPDIHFLHNSYSIVQIPWTIPKMLRLLSCVKNSWKPSIHWAESNIDIAGINYSMRVGLSNLNYLYKIPLLHLKMKLIQKYYRSNKFVWSVHTFVKIIPWEHSRGHLSILWLPLSFDFLDFDRTSTACVMSPRRMSDIKIQVL